MSFVSQRARLIPLPGHGMRRSLLLSLLFIALTFGGGVRAQESKEYQLKAAFLYNFAQFCKWPPGSFESESAPFVIGVLGDDPFGSALDETVHNAAIGNHKLSVVRSSKLDDLKNCQLIYVCRSEDSHLDDILSQLSSRPVLIVGEGENFTHSGGIIDFYISGGKVRFEINPSSAQRHGLKISSQLLSLGKIAGGD